MRLIENSSAAKDIGSENSSAAKDIDVVPSNIQNKYCHFKRIKLL